MGKSGGKNSTKKSPPPGVPSSSATPPPAKREEKKPPPTKAIAAEFDYGDVEIEVTEPEEATTVATADTSIPALELAPPPQSVDETFEAMNFEEVIAAATPAPIPTAIALPTAEELAAEIPKNAEGVPLYSPSAWAKKKAREQRK